MLRIKLFQLIDVLKISLLFFALVLLRHFHLAR